MDTAHEWQLTRHTSSLKRYARALAGDQQRADAAVHATLASIRDSETETGSGGYRELLYARFSSVWNELHHEAPAIAMSSSSAADRLRDLPSIARQAFLLFAVEDFNDAQIGRILGVDLARVAQLKQSARAVLTDNLATDALIIEDELFIAADLEEIMQSLGHRVIAIERTRKAAVEAARKQRPGIILADIQLADGSNGIDAVNDMLSEFDVPVVFITAYPERLLTGIRPEPAFVLTKPFKAETVRAVVSQALLFNSQRKGAAPSRLAAEAAS